MARTYSIAEARSNLPAIVDQAEAGVAVELTRRGRPVAVVVSRAEFERLREPRRDFAGAYRRFLARFPPEDRGLEPELEALRDRSVGRQVRL